MRRLLGIPVLFISENKDGLHSRPSLFSVFSFVLDRVLENIRAK